VAAPDFGAVTVVCEQFAMCSLGCGRLGRAVLWLELERWYVGTAVLKGGVGGLPGVVEQLDVRAAAPKALSVACIEILCRVGDEVILMLVVGVVWRSSSEELTSLSLLERPVLAPPIVLMAYSLRLW
jgi:hypothetical protein